MSKLLFELQDKVRRLTEMLDFIEFSGLQTDSKLAHPDLNRLTQACIGSMFIAIPNNKDEPLPKTPVLLSNDIAYQRMVFCAAMGYRTLRYAHTHGTDVYNVNIRMTAVNDELFSIVSKIENADYK